MKKIKIFFNPFCFFFALLGASEGRVTLRWKVIGEASFQRRKVQWKEIREFAKALKALAKTAPPGRLYSSYRGLEVESPRWHGNMLTGVWYECIPDPEFPRADNDRCCLLCEGWGCCACSHTGGY